MYAISVMMMNKVIFSSFFDLTGGDDGYYVSEMPGEIKGIHGSCLTGLNIGVAKYLSKKKNKSCD